MVVTAVYSCALLWVADPSVAGARCVRRHSHSLLEGSNHEAAVEQGLTLEERLDLLAAKASLTPREREIVGYLARGHSGVFVAKTLMISESTVYTHVRNMYRKLGIGSREELVGLLSEK